RLPFMGSTTEVIAKVMSEPVRWPGELRPDLPRDLARVVMRALNRDRKQRFQSMPELAAALAPFGPAQSAADVVADAQRGRGRLGEILVTEGLISQADLGRALEEQRRSGRLLGRVLLDQGLVAHADLLTALAKQQGIGAASAAATGMVRERMSREAVTISSPVEPAKKALRVRWPWIVLAIGVGLGLGVVLALTARSAREAPPSVASASVVPQVTAPSQTPVTLSNLPPAEAVAPSAPEGADRRPAAAPPKPSPQPHPARRPAARFEPETL
ncbi:MAG TPA: hypothetical protein VKU41_13710, partial [Polyangiaceae bacterium]|nr:hypothetical protein [Polyangiaceae bacterium]